jgi:hypothetical protein
MNLLDGCISLVPVPGCVNGACVGPLPRGCGHWGRRTVLLVATAAEGIHATDGTASFALADTQPPAGMIYQALVVAPPPAGVAAAAIVVAAVVPRSLDPSAQPSQPCALLTYAVTVDTLIQGLPDLQTIRVRRCGDATPLAIFPLRVFAPSAVDGAAPRDVLDVVVSRVPPAGTGAPVPPVSLFSLLQVDGVAQLAPAATATDPLVAAAVEELTAPPLSMHSFEDAAIAVGLLDGALRVVFSATERAAARRWEGLMSGPASDVKLFTLLPAEEPGLGVDGLGDGARESVATHATTPTGGATLRGALAANGHASTLNLVALNAAGEAVVFFDVRTAADFAYGERIDDDYDPHPPAVEPEAPPARTLGGHSHSLGHTTLPVSASMAGPLPSVLQEQPHAMTGHGPSSSNDASNQRMNAMIREAEAAGDQKASRRCFALLAQGPLCVLVADVDADGVNELVIATSSRQLVVCRFRAAAPALAESDSGSMLHSPGAFGAPALDTRRLACGAYHVLDTVSQVYALAPVPDARGVRRLFMLGPRQGFALAPLVTGAVLDVLPNRVDILCHLLGIKDRRQSTYLI